MLHTRSALTTLGVVDMVRETSCIFSFNVVETCRHIFFECSFSYSIWHGVAAWLGIQGAFPLYSIHHFLKHGSYVRGKKF